MLAKTKNIPAIFIALFVPAMFGIIAIGHLITNRPLIFLDYYKNARGLDYLDFFRASENLLNGKSPYDIPDQRYVTTPIPALFNTVLVPLGFDRARILLYFLIPVGLTAGYLLITSAAGISGPHKSPVQLAGLACLLFGYPFYFLLQRENIDGWVFLLLCAGLFWMQKPRQEFLSGLAFSLAIAFKVYPVLILLPLILQRRWRLLLWLGVWLGVWVGISLLWFPGLKEAIARRTIALFRLDENGSLMALVYLAMFLLQAIGVPIPSDSMGFWPYIALFIFGLLLATAVFADFKRKANAAEGVMESALYLPFMLALPSVVFHYSLVICIILIPVVCRLWENSETRRQRSIILTITLGIALTQWQAIAAFVLTGNILANGIPGAGLLLMMAGVTLYKMDAQLGMARSVPASSLLPDGKISTE